MPMTGITPATYPNPTTTELLVAVFDLTNYVAFSRQTPSPDQFAKMNEFYRRSAEFVRDHGGYLIKFIGDAGLVVFPADAADHGVNTMVRLKDEMDAWLKSAIPESTLSVNCHFGEVTIGPMHGPGGGKHLDIIGDTVNICFTLGRKKFILSPQAFRKLKPESRRRFKKFTPPVVYNLS
jgi:class 3 adenylate cyclase